MSLTGIKRIDDLWQGNGASPIRSGDSDRESIGVLQDLLRGHGYSLMPGPASPAYGLFGPRTSHAVREFRTVAGLAPAEEADSETLRKLVQIDPVDPVASRPYVTLGLGRAWDSMTKVLLLTAQLEGMGRFGALNLNTDWAGLSFGIIQWAQKPGRLAEIVEAFRNESLEEFFRIFGDGNGGVAAGLLAHARLPKGGIVPATGETADPAFDLIRAPWTDRFLKAARRREWQKVQIDVAMTAFETSLAKIRDYGPEIRTERAVAFQLDLANQYGDAGARGIFLATRKTGQSLRMHMEAMAEESVRRIAAKFKSGVRLRRRIFLDTPLLADTEITHVILA